MCAHAGGEAAVPFEVTLELLRIDTFRLASRRLLGAVAEHLGPGAVEVNQLLGHHLPLGRVGVEQLRRRLPRSTAASFQPGITSRFPCPDCTADL